MCDRIISDDPFSLRYVPDQYKTQQVCDKAVDDCLVVLQFVSDCFVTNKIIKIFLLFCIQMELYSILIKIMKMVMLYFILMEWVFLI